MTKEAIEARIQQLQREQEQLVAKTNAFSGAIQDCKYWLEQLEKPIEKTE